MEALRKFGDKLKVRESNKSIQTKEKEAFVKTISALEISVSRAMALEELGFDIEKIEESYMEAIESLLNIHYSSWKIDIIYWCLYDREDEDGNIQPLIIENADKQTEAIVNNPTELWELLCQMEKQIKPKK